MSIEAQDDDNLFGIDVRKVAEDICDIGMKNSREIPAEMLLAATIEALEMQLHAAAMAAITCRPDIKSTLLEACDLLDYKTNLIREVLASKDTPAS